MSRVESKVTSVEHKKPQPAADYYQAAVNNELIRLIWACFKEEYVRAGDPLSFTVADGAGGTAPIGCIEDAQRILYDATLKDDLVFGARVDGRALTFNNTEDLLNALLPSLQRAYPDLQVCSERWANWLAVSQHAVNNEALAIANKVRLDEEIARGGSVLEHALRLSPNESFAFFCRYAGYFGRYDMPFSKMRLPVDSEDAPHYAPEFGHDVPVVLAALRLREARSNTCADFNLNSLIEQEFPAAFQTWRQALLALERQPDDYMVLPIHPLSLPLYESKLAALIDAQDLIVDTAAVILCKASLSYRTMIPNGKESRLLFKLPVPLQLTGYQRHIDLEELRWAPQLSNVLADIMTDEADFGGRLRLDRELASGWVAPRSDSADDQADVQFLSCLIRENQSRGLPPDCVTMPLAALFSASSIGGKPLLVEAMERGGVASQTQAQTYFQTYLDATLGSVLRMYLRHGVMLEAHQQNLGVTLDASGWLRMLHYHDIACAVFICRPVYLAAGHHELSLSGLSHPYVADPMQPSCVQFVHTVLLLNLLPVIDIIAARFDLPKALLLRQTAAAIRAIVAEEGVLNARRAPAAAAIFARFHAEFIDAVLGSPTFSSKRLLGRLFRQSQTARWGRVPNHDPEFSGIKGAAIAIANPLFAEPRA